MLSRRKHPGSGRPSSRGEAVQQQQGGWQQRPHVATGKASTEQPSEQLCHASLIDSFRGVDRLATGVLPNPTHSNSAPVQLTSTVPLTPRGQRACRGGTT